VDQGLADTLWSRISSHISSTVLEDDCIWLSSGLNECFRLSKYVSGDVFKSHVDTCYVKNSEEKSMYTVNVYLNGMDDFEGGHTRFFDNNCEMEYSVTPITGSALIFRQPPTANYRHDGEMVKDGYKYLLRTDVMYRKMQS
jgi:prolyl 4-hydroxylase